MEKPPQIVHLHSHTEYSLLDGACQITDEKGKPSEWLKTIAAMGMPALAMTDHGNLSGAIEFYSSCTAVGVKPIIGCEMYIAPGSRFDRTTKRGQEDAYYHFTVLAQNEVGYKNLMKLSSIGYLEGFYYKPRVDKEILAKHSEGLIALSGCLKGELAEALLADKEPQALKIIDDYQNIFGKENYYLELMDHGLPDQRRQNDKLLTLADKTGLPLVATNDCHYFKKTDAPTHDILLCIGTGSGLDDPKRMRFEANEFYYKSAKEMYEVFSARPDAVKRTLEIAERCNLQMRFDQTLLPHFDVPAGDTVDTYLEKLCMKGLITRYGDQSPRYHERLQYELGVVQRMGFSAYFLIVWDFIHYAKKNGIPVGPGRGSGAGSLVAYSLAITDVCPVKYGLLFERFLNPDRKTMPDLDIDFSDEGREQVIRYVRQKYGEASVAQIVTFGSMQARLVLRDVGRVLGIPLTEVDRIAKLIPKELGVTIASARQNVPELNAEAKQNPQMAKLLEVAQQLEGLKRHTGVHAAGVVVGKGDLTDYVPLAKGSKDVVTTQYEGESLLKLGLLKMDFLGLRTLTVIDKACKLIRQKHIPDFDIAKIPLDDPATFKLLQEAKAMGIFQLESSGMRDLLRKLHPTVFEEIIALIALYRPGPMGAGMLDEFVKRKHNAASIKFDHPILEPILKETYGVILYQEQVMKIAVDFGGFTPGQADGMRKAMGKKIAEELQKQRGAFIEGAKAKDIKEKLAVSVFEQIVHFGGYGFNKSHSTAYGLVSYQTAYLKANYTVEFMTALMTSEIGHGAVAGKEEDSKLVTYFHEAEALGITVLPPDIQKSFAEFAIEETTTKEGTPKAAIRFGLLAVKNVGTGAVESMIASRNTDGPFKSLDDLCQRIDLRQANRKVLESLIKAGALDGFSTDKPLVFRPRALLGLNHLMERSSKLREESQSGQGALFDLGSVMSSAPLPRTETSSTSASAASDFDWSDKELLGCEKEVLGFYLSGHPMAQYQTELHLFSSQKLGQLPTTNDMQIRIAGMISSVRRLMTKAKKEPYARCRFEDLEGEVDLIIFPKAYASGISQLLVPGEMMVVKGRINRREDSQPEVIVEDMTPFAQAREKFVSELLIRMGVQGLEEQALEDLKQTLQRYPGRCQVCLEVQTAPETKVVVETEFLVKPTPALFEEIEKRLGRESWQITRVGR